jgi:hypothetical protein
MAKTATQDKRVKILVGIAGNLLDALNRLCDAGCFRRDALLEQIIAGELDNLEREVTKANSEQAYQHINQHVKLLRRTSVTLSIEGKTANRLDEICERKRLVRDAFVNRLIFCLVAPARLLNVSFEVETYGRRVVKQWGTPADEHAWQFLRMTPECISDPFWFLRACLELSNEDLGGDATFYTTYFPENLFGDGEKAAKAGRPPPPNSLGLNVYLPDEMVLGSAAHAAMMEALDIKLEPLRKAAGRK